MGRPKGEMLKCDTCGKAIKKGQDYIYDVRNDLISCTQKCKDKYHKVRRNNIRPQQ